MRSVSKIIPVGTVCYHSGSYFEKTEKVIVTKKNQKIVSEFWNKLYFKNKEDALKVEWKDRESYRDYYINW